MYTYMQTIMNENETELSDSLFHPYEDAVDADDRTAFLAAINRSAIPRRQEHVPSVIRRWTTEQGRRDWLARMQEYLLDLEKKSAEFGRHLQDMFRPLVTVNDILMQRLEPVPTVRDAAAAKEMIYKPRRRAIEAADLPAFNPLFCTAIDREAEATTISGLNPEERYVFSLIAVDHPDLQEHHGVQSSPHGGVVLDIAGMLDRLQKQAGTSVKFAWFLQEEDDRNASERGWISGLVWLESEQTRKMTQEAHRILADIAGGEHEDTDIETLIEINLFIAREFYMKAYERARQGLLFQPKLSRFESKVPYQESLWQFIMQLIDKILVRLETAEAVFRAVKSEWRAVSSLRELRRHIAEWE
ncbi:MAG: hypothetical protein C4527_04870 [Candidatus Omnitrophota bacterium]|nr:MAG: hypothetical protein C4527_04870 [Candidatus Omnitrophota bacterium]